MHIEIPSFLFFFYFFLIYFSLISSSSFFSLLFLLSCRGGIFLFGSNRYSTYFHIYSGKNRHGHTLIISSHSHPTTDNIVTQTQNIHAHNANKNIFERRSERTSKNITHSNSLCVWRALSSAAYNRKFPRSFSRRCRWLLFLLLLLS